VTLRGSPASGSQSRFQFRISTGFFNSATGTRNSDSHGGLMSFVETYYEGSQHGGFVNHTVVRYGG
jgi:hypothetical protein